VLPNGTPEAESVCKQLVAKLRELGVAARHTYKTTRNVGKLLQEASASKAVAAIIVEGESVLTLKVLQGPGAGRQAQFAAAELSPLLGALAQLGVRPR
jgi:hypothetical protein